MSRLYEMEGVAILSACKIHLSIFTFQCLRFSQADYLYIYAYLMTMYIFYCIVTSCHVYASL